MVEIERTRERCIFLMQNYYIVIPMSNQVKILLNIMDDVDNEKIKELPLLNDQVIVVPILNKQTFDYLATPQATYSSDSMNYFLKLINNIKGLLIHNQKQVDNLVIINDNSKFSNFINYFVLNASGISVQKSNGDLLKNNIISSNNVNETMLNANIGNDVPLAYPQDVGVQDKVEPKVQTNKGEPGFVSYVLLGVVIAIMSLVFLYMLI